MTTTATQANMYQRKAQATRKRKTYPTERQRRAFSHYLRGHRIEDLTVQEIKALSTHPYLLQRQRDKFAAMLTEAK